MTFFAHGYRMVPEQFVENTLSPLNCLFTFDKNQLTIYLWIYFVFSIVFRWLCWWQYYTVSIPGSPNFFFFKVVLVILDPLDFCFNFRISLLIVKKILLGFWLRLHRIYTPFWKNWYPFQVNGFFIIVLVRVFTNCRGQN